LIDSCTDALGGLARARSALASDPESALRHVEAARRLVVAVGELSRRGGWLRLRLRARAVATADKVKAAGLRGPVARASGLFDDARGDDPLYRRLGFMPVVRSEGDALARTLLRIDEAVQGVTLASAALKETSGGRAAGLLPEASASGVIEGPRGPLQAERTSDGWRLVTHGAPAILEAAAKAMVGAEWSTALAGLASFDVSPWRVEQ
jgi:Ni,Fe-hydrogenase III large subunit